MMALRRWTSTPEAAGDLLSSSLRSEEPATGEAEPARATELPVGETEEVSARGATLVPRPICWIAGAGVGAWVGAVWGRGCSGLGASGMGSWTCRIAGAGGTGGSPAAAPATKTPRTWGASHPKRAAVERRMNPALLGIRPGGGAWGRPARPAPAGPAGAHLARGAPADALLGVDVINNRLAKPRGSRKVSQREEPAE